jgi:hypothetical protein
MLQAFEAGRHATGFREFEYSLSGKWLQLLKEVAPRTVRAAIIRESGPGGIGRGDPVGGVIAGR